MTDQVVNMLAGYFEEIRHIPAVEKVCYKKESSGVKSDIDLLGVQDIPILVEEKSTQPFVKFKDIKTAELDSIQSKLRKVLEKWSDKVELQKGWKEHFKAEAKKVFLKSIVTSLMHCYFFLTNSIIQ